MTHAESQVKHAKLRAAERYGVDLNSCDLLEIIRLVQKSKTVVIASQSHTRVVHDVFYRGMKYRAVYHKKTKQISTFLPPDEEVRPYLTNTPNGVHYGN